MNPVLPRLDQLEHGRETTRSDGGFDTNCCDNDRIRASYPQSRDRRRTVLAHKEPMLTSLLNRSYRLEENANPGAPGLNVRCSPFVLAITLLLGSIVFAHGADQDRGPEPFPSATPKAVVEVTGIIFPSVVRLDVAQEIYSEGKRTVRRGIGSGVIIDNDGRILTNFHVAGRAAEIFVTLFNKERVPAKLVGDDHWTDLAVVQMDMDHVKAKNIQFKAAVLGESKGLITGQDVMAIGTPFGLARTMTLGIVSNNERTFYPERMTIDEYETGQFSNWIQMDTPINPGNSGGPLVDLTGKVVGINTRGGGQNLNFAIPIDTAKEVISKILASATKDKRAASIAATWGSISSRSRTWKPFTTSTSITACWSTAWTATRRRKRPALSRRTFSSI